MFNTGSRLFFSAKSAALPSVPQYVYVGGTFNSAGGVTVNKVARWNGTAWSALSTGIAGFGFALAYGPEQSS